MEDETPPPRLSTNWNVDLDGFEGPIDLLLNLARDRKIDLTAISISALADQYLAFIAHAKDAKLEIAAEYLVMAAWLAYLKSRLLLPRDQPLDGGPTGEQLAEAFAEKLRYLEAMQKAAKALMALPRNGRDWSLRQAPAGLLTTRETTWEADLTGLLRAYAGIVAKRTPPAQLTVDPGLLTSIDSALARLEALLGTLPLWMELETFLPRDLRPGTEYRSALASSFVASLELAKAGRVHLHQDETFGPLHLSPRSAPPSTTDDQSDG